MANDTMTADEIRALRERLGMSQTAFGEALGSNQTTVSRWERGTNPAGRVFVRLMRQLAANQDRKDARAVARQAV